MSVELEGWSLSVIEEKHGGIFGLGSPQMMLLRNILQEKAT